MSDSLKTSLRWLGTGCFLALVLFVAPNCAFQTGGLCDKPDGCDAGKPPDCPPDKPDCNAEPCNDPSCPPVPCDKPDCMDPNPPPPMVYVPGDNATDLILCDFPNAEKPMVSACATQAEVDAGGYLSQSAAATSLANSQNNFFTLDWSQAAMNECGNLPKKVEFLGGAFPDGAKTCINASTQFPNVYANPTKACIAKCEDTITNGFGPFPPNVHDYCVANAHTSTNFDPAGWYPNGCTPGGTPIPMGWVDPRRTPEPVKWTDLIGTTDNGGTNTITQTAATTGPTLADYKSGGASEQLITKGDAWIEFSASETDAGHHISLRTSCAVIANCADQDPTLSDLGYAIILDLDGKVYVRETIPVDIAYGPFGTYTVGERYRIRVADNHNGTATISYSRLLEACPVGTFCDEQILRTADAAVPYPLRVDASLRIQNSALSNVNIMRIKE